MANADAASALAVVVVRRLDALDPLCLLTFLLRLTSQVQFGAPRLFHPARSLRFFFVACTFINASAIVVHALDGSQGTKGSNWSQRGLFVDFVGQVATPSKIHLLVLDLIIAFLQYLVIIVGFAEQPSQLALQIAQARFQGDLPPSRDYSSLLGPTWNKEDVEDEDEDDDDRIGLNDENGNGFREVFEDGEEDEEQEIVFDASTSYPPTNFDETRPFMTSSDPPPPLRKRSSHKTRTKSFTARSLKARESTTLIDIRWANVWKELKSSGTSPTARTTSDVDVERMEEGRSGPG
ncbi:hypothetical protein ACM66B_001831 [Microbotryomycetes sp. NB124-2]